MKLFAAVLVVCVAFASAEFQEKTEEDFCRISASCVETLKVPSELVQQYDQFIYPNDEITKKFLRCVFSGLELYSDEKGYNVEHIAALYKDKASPEKLLPYLSACNANPDKKASLEHSYDAFNCIMKGDVGAWFKADIAKAVASGKAKA